MTKLTDNDSYLLLRAFCDELARCGVRDACTSPGSRSTPIVLSLVREPRIRCWSHIDERCAGFFALGAAKASGRPAALTCTSGTAAANYAPAVIEAHHARVPLIVLTADRPPELRDVGAGQAIDQLKLYGDAVKWFVEVGVHEASSERLRWIRALACRAYWMALAGPAGPVHLNFPLREPLVLDDPLPADPVPGRPDGRPWLRRAHAPDTLTREPRPLPPRGVVVAGAGASGSDVARFAQRVGYPLLADPLSGARHSPAAIARYDLLLRDDSLTRRVNGSLVLVIRVGDLPTSKPLRSWLQALTATEQLALDPESAGQDPAAAVTELELGDPLAALCACERSGPADPAWLSTWIDADDAASQAIDRELGDELTEPLVAARLGDWLGPQATLFVASSMPIRDVELFFGARSPGPRVLSNRGANGIDGTVSSAFGVAGAIEGPVVLLIGDVALLHDVGGLLAARRLGLALTIVLINNDGGGIFHFLPVSGEPAVFERHVATPHGVRFEDVADVYGLRYAQPGSAGELHDAVTAGLGSSTTALIEVRSDRAANLTLHRRLADAALATV